MRRASGLAGLVVLLVGAFALGLALTWARDRDAAPLASGPRDRPPQLIDEVRQELVTGYYQRVPSVVLAADSIDELIAGLHDPYTDYLTPYEYAALRARTARTYSGVGLTVGRARGGLLVKAAIDGPARDAGIRPGDLIVSIDGQRVRSLPFHRSLDLIKGREGTVVRLRVRRPREGTLHFSVKRATIELTALRGRIVRVGKTKVAYVRLRSFRANAAETLRHRARSLLRAGAKGFLIDLRDNPGGLLSEAVKTVSLFVDDGVVCLTEGRNRRRRAYEVAGTAAYPRIPIVVLVNRGSASAAEIVAAALADHDRALVIGQRTYGKAAVQSVRGLSNGGALKMTTAVFVTPAGRNLTRNGLTPDLKAVDDPRTRLDEALTAAKSAVAEHIAK